MTDLFKKSKKNEPEEQEEKTVKEAPEESIKQAAESEPEKTTKEAPEESIKQAAESEPEKTTKEAPEETTKQATENEPKKNRKKAGLIAGVVVGSLLILYIGFGIFFQGHFCFRTTVNGIPASMASAKTMTDRLTAAADAYELVIIAEGEKDESLSVADVGMTIDITEENVKEILREQNSFLWGYYLLTGKEYTKNQMISCDKSEIRKAVQTLACVKNKNPIKTKNATVTYRSGAFEIVDEVYGNEISEKTLVDDIYAAVLELRPELDLREAGSYKQPKLTADSKEIKELKKKLNKSLDSEIVYEIGQEKETLTKDVFAKWLTGDNNADVAFDEEAMADYISGMARTYDTYGRAKQLSTRYGATVTVAGGNYGWRIDKDKEREQLKKDILSGKTVTRDFVYQYKAASREGNDYGNSYVEINKTAQQLYLVIDGNTVLETPVVTGAAGGEHDTPVGAYRITYCEKNATLRGPGYATPVAYWMPFNGDIGLHDATWQKSFGGARYREGYGSHGCVNLPLSAAGTIFGYVSTGFPVLLYDLPGTETVDTLSRQEAENCKNAIAAIGTVTLDSAYQISVARGAYDALTESGKTCVDNYQALLDAEATYFSLKTADDQKRQKEQDMASAKEVTEMINRIGEVTKESKEAIVNAEKAYQALTQEAKAYVKNYDVLREARKTFDAL